ncbi:MAG TPA: DUF1801 domain-containing protein [Ohtaekwangia sp.]|uniref:DUF1801 domain-containing protein n=1 Tax=Ohtaekwangia sp. TaxID=2066019 RepID=UPI002F93D5DE
MTVSHFIAEARDPHREIMTIFRAWVMDLGAHVQQKISNKIPYFYFYGPLCYFNPVGEGIDIGFARGNELSNEEGLLEARGRKHVRSITFHSVAELEENEETLRHILNEAAILNEYHFKRKKQKSAHA